MSPKPQFTVMLAVLLSGCAGDASGTGGETEPVSYRESALCNNALSATEEKTALKLIDDICGDTWCEGDNDFAFERLTCRAGDPTNGGSCALQLRIIPREEGSRSYPRVCRTGAFFGFSSLVDTASNGYQSLEWDYYLALTDCITELQSELPR